MELVKNYFNELSKKANRTNLDFYKLINNNHNEQEISTMLFAYRRAYELHGGKKRKSGELYITHPVSVACFLLERGFDYETICAALLHDTVEDTCYTLEDAEQEFGKTIAHLIDGVTKMRKTDFTSKEEQKIATHKKIIKESAKDARIIAIKLADRLHNMLTLEILSPNKIKEIAIETMNFYVPIARLLGIYQMKDELQDLSMLYLNQDQYLNWYYIRNEIKNRYFPQYHSIKNTVSSELLQSRITLDYDYKVKNVAGIYSEINSGKKIDDINDLVAIRMRTESVSNCYKVLNLIKSTYKVIPDTFIDHIQQPKYNGYSSLITNIKTANDANFQVRIRTNDMQRANDLGVISNWNPVAQKTIEEMCTNFVGSDLSYIDSNFDPKNFDPKIIKRGGIL